jgi:DNA uptake protein ComE-like DNA-binding protein
MFKRVADWFYMTPQERVGSSVLMVLLILTIIAKTGVIVYTEQKVKDDAAVLLSNPLLPQASMTNKDASTHRMDGDSPIPQTATPADHFHVFDPNTESEKGLQSLGLSEDLSRRLIKYREAGGVFYTPEDVLRIYGMDSLWWQTAKRFMAFASNNADLPDAPTIEYRLFDPNTVSQSDAISLGFSDWQYDRLVAHRSRRPLSDPEDLNLVYGLDPHLLSTLKPFVRIADDFRGRIDLNSADTIRLKHIEGVGSYFAKQIVGLRALLGSFPSHDVLWAIPKMDSVRWLSIRSQSVCASETTKRLSINHDDAETLSSHPFISPSFAREIIEFRENFRPFISVDELEELSLFPKMRKHAILPYITID